MVRDKLKKTNKKNTNNKTIKKTNRNKSKKSNRKTTKYTSKDANKKISKKVTNKVYTNDDFNSGDGMLTSVWGPSMWHYLHTMSFNYPVHPSNKDKKNYRNFVLNLKNVLPCKYCRINLKNNFKQKPLTMEKMKNRESFSRYIYELHELVNKMLGKKSGLTYKEVRERYEHFRARCTVELPIKNVDIVKNIIKKSKKSKTRKNKKEKGCTEPLYGKKSKCVIKIVPQEEKCDTFQIDDECIKKKRLNV